MLVMEEKLEYHEIFNEDSSSDGNVGLLLLNLNIFHFDPSNETRPLYLDLVRQSRLWVQFCAIVIFSS